MTKIKKDDYDRLSDKAIEYCLEKDYPDCYSKEIGTNSEFKFFDIYETSTRKFKIRLRLIIISDFQTLPFDDNNLEYFETNPPFNSKEYSIGDCYITYDKEFKHSQIIKRKTIA